MCSSDLEPAPVNSEVRPVPTPAAWFPTSGQQSGRPLEGGGPTLSVRREKSTAPALGLSNVRGGGTLLALLDLELDGVTLG